MSDAPSEPPRRPVQVALPLGSWSGPASRHAGTQAVPPAEPPAADAPARPASPSPAAAPVRPVSLREARRVPVRVQPVTPAELFEDPPAPTAGSTASRQPDPGSAVSVARTAPEPEPAAAVTLPAELPFGPGDRIGEGYLLLTALRATPDTCSFRAFDTVHRQLVDLKLWLGPGSGFGVAREAQVLARLDHPGLARSLGVGSVGGMPYLVTEHVEGTVLADIARHRCRFAPVDALRIVHRLGQALRHAERRGLPQARLDARGVLLRPDGSVRLIDRELERQPADRAFASIVPALGKLLALMVGPECPPPLAALVRRLDERHDVFDYTALLASLELTARDHFGADTSDWPEPEPAPPTVPGRDEPADGVVARFRAN
ncbi:MAG: protein kinase [Planctomycetes bacterium]|nr:protein kinase [Planctomycetota bacterium]